MATIEETLDKAIAVAVKRAMLAAHPVGSLYLSLTDDNPKNLLGGEWVKVGSGKCLWGADSSHAAGTEIAAGLPNIEATVSRTNTDSGVIDQKRAVTTTGAFTVLETGSNSYSGTSSYASGAIPAKFGFDASLSNSIYGNSTTVQPPALAVNIWKRTS